MPNEKGATKTDLAVTAERIAGGKPSFALVQDMTRQLIDGVRNGKLPDWFGPGAPRSPTAPAILAGRQFDFPVAINTINAPHVGEGLPPATLRAVADACGILRLVIETRKDTLCKLEWTIRPRDEKAKPDAACEAIDAFFRMPDKEHTWAQWLRAILEDLFVIDAVSLWPQMARSGELYAMQLVDGGTIKRVIDDYGRTPLPPYPAYQQYLKGLPALDYTLDELVYMPQNVRTNKLYGYSVVEQIIGYINMALKRQVYQMEYYDSGSTPDLILGVPDTWTPDQIGEFKLWWDSVLEGNLKARRGTMFVHNSTDVINTKEQILTDKFDEWLARIVCFAFGMSPAPFVQMMNRATSEQADTTSKEEGIGPLKDYIRDLINCILIKYFKRPDLSFKFKDEEQVSQEQRVKTQDTKIKNGSLTINEAREEDGREPIEGGDTPLLFATVTTLDRVLEPPEPPAIPGAALSTVPGAKAAKPVKGSGGSPDKKKEEIQKLQKSVDGEDLLAQLMAKTLADVAASVAEQAGAALGALVKARKPVNHNNPIAQGIVDALDLSAFQNAQTAVESVFVAEVSKASTSAAAALGNDSLFELTPQVATEFAAARAVELVGKGPQGGMLGDSTRLLIRGLIAEAVDNGWTVEELRDALVKDYAFAKKRAALIAENEIRVAVNEGNLRTWEKSGLVEGKIWLLSNDEGICDICTANAKQKTIPLGKSFVSGHRAPPAHPRCRCSMAPVTTFVPADNQ